MCDWEEAEFAEYLLWVEAAKARAKATAPPVPHEKMPRERFRGVPEPIPAEA